MKLPRSWILTIAAFAVVIPAAVSMPATSNAAEDWDFSVPYTNRCSTGSQHQMNVCLTLEREQVELRLDALYKSLIAVLSDSSKLEQSQTAWHRFRDLTCEYESSGIATSGDLHRYMWDACLIDLTEKRIRDIQRYTEWDCNGCPPRK